MKRVAIRSKHERKHVFNLSGCEVCFAFEYQRLHVMYFTDATLVTVDTQSEDAHVVSGGTLIG